MQIINRDCSEMSRFADMTSDVVYSRLDRGPRVSRPISDIKKAIAT